MGASVLFFPEGQPYTAVNTVNCHTSVVVLFNFRCCQDLKLQQGPKQPIRPVGRDDSSRPLMDVVTMPDLNTGSFYVFAFALPLRLRYVNKSNELLKQLRGSPYSVMFALPMCYRCFIIVYQSM